MQICTRCLYHSSHPLNITFDSEGVCSGCRIHEEKDIINWSERDEELKELLNSFANRHGSNYDCVIPVSGARDSYFIVHTVKNIYGLNPLLVTYNKHYNTAVGWRNLANLRTKFDCDIMTLTVNPNQIKKITRTTFRQFGSIYWHCIAGQTVFPVQIAVKFKIPLIVWGAHQGIDQVGMFSHHDRVEMTRKYRKDHDLMGYEAEDLVNDIDNVTLDDVMPFMYPDNVELEKVGVRGIYLNNYIRWDSRIQHELMIKTYDYESCNQNRTFDTYNDVDCWNYSSVHDYIKWVKHGYGKVVDHACREIRLRHMTRQEGIDLVESYMTKTPANLDKFISWIGITEESFNYILDQHRSTEFFQRNDDWSWNNIENLIEKYHNSPFDPSYQSESVFEPFTVTPSKSSLDSTSEYVLIGKGC